VSEEPKNHALDVQRSKCRTTFLLLLRHSHIHLSQCGNAQYVLCNQIFNLGGERVEMWNLRKRGTWATENNIRR